MNAKTVITTQRILQEHEEIEALTASLMSELAKRQCVKPRIISLLTSLNERMTAHFCDEEHGGFLETRVRDQPDLAGRCKELCREHQVMQNELAELLRVAEAGDADKAWWDRLENRFHTFSISLANHEFREASILQELEDE